MMGAIVLEILLWSSSSNLSCPWNPSLSAICFSRTFCKRMDTWPYFFFSFTGYTDHRPDFLLYVLCSLQLDEYTYIENSYVPIQVHILCMHVWVYIPDCPISIHYWLPVHIFIIIQSSQNTPCSVHWWGISIPLGGVH